MAGRREMKVDAARLDDALKRACQWGRYVTLALSSNRLESRTNLCSKIQLGYSGIMLTSFTYRTLDGGMCKWSSGMQSNTVFWRMHQLSPM